MEDVTVLVTGAGAPGIAGTVYSLRNNPEGRKVRIIGVDCDPDAAGRLLCDEFYRVPRGELGDEFLAALEEICDMEEAHVLLPQVTAELVWLSDAGDPEQTPRGLYPTRVALSREAHLYSNKWNLQLAAKEHSIPRPATTEPVKEWHDLTRAIERLGYPHKPVIVKPVEGSGGRGVRKVVEKLPEFGGKRGIEVTLGYLREEIGDTPVRLIAQEYLPGDEYSVDMLAGPNGAPIMTVPRRRIRIRDGITFDCEVEARTDIAKEARKLTQCLGLEYAHGFQFKCDADGVPKLLECNPRIQGTMVASTLAGANVIWGAVKLALGEEVQPPTIKWGTRFQRYWGGVASLPVETGRV